MKKLFLIFLIGLSINTFAQHEGHTGHEMKKTEVVTATTSKTPFGMTLQSYYDLKNALVATDGKLASQKADELMKNMKGLSTANADEKKLIEKLFFDAEHINETKDPEHQRDHFNSLSNNLFALAKLQKSNENAIYQQYCPMKKSYWLSESSAVKNPYYGDKMLTCGKVVNTISADKK
jgi:hypothetical protein